MCLAVFDAADDGNVVILRFRLGDSILSLNLVDGFLFVLFPLLICEIIFEKFLLRWNGRVKEEFDALPDISDILCFLKKPVAWNHQALDDVSSDNDTIFHFFTNSKNTSAIVCADVNELMLHISGIQLDNRCNGSFTNRQICQR